MKSLSAMTLAVMALLFTAGAMAQNGGMMNGRVSGDGWMGGFGVPWVLILLVVLIAGLVFWIIARNRK